MYINFKVSDNDKYLYKAIVYEEGKHKEVYFGIKANKKKYFTFGGSEEDKKSFKIKNRLTIGKQK